MTDYFERDTIRVVPSHPLYAQVASALKARNEHYDQRFEWLIEQFDIHEKEIREGLGQQIDKLLEQNVRLMNQDLVLATIIQNLSKQLEAEAAARKELATATASGIEQLRDILLGRHERKKDPDPKPN